MNIGRYAWLAVIVVAGLLGIITGHAQNGSHPGKPVRPIVPLSTGDISQEGNPDVQSFTDGYPPALVHRDAHGIAPGAHGGLEFTPMQPGDNANVRTGRLRESDAGTMLNGYVRSNRRCCS